MSDISSDTTGSLAYWAAGAALLAFLGRAAAQVLAAGRYTKDQESALARVEASFTTGFSKLKADIEAQLTDKFHKLETRLMEHDYKNEAVSAKIAALEVAMTAVQKRSAATTHRLTELTSELKSLRERVDRYERLERTDGQ